MNKDFVLKALSQKFPDKHIVVNEDNGFFEIICELEPTFEHSDYSKALVVVGKSKPHFHSDTVETYEVLQGELKVVISDKSHYLKAGEKITIPKGQTPSVEGTNTWFMCYSTPGWRFDDHFII